MASQAVSSNVPLQALCSTYPLASLTDKEQYHTAITRLLSLRDLATYDIREIWSIDFPNHGEAATLNRHLLDGHKANSVQQKVDGTCSECLSWFIKIRCILDIH